LAVKPDDSELIADGRDATRVVLAVADAFGNFRPFATGAIQLRSPVRARLWAKIRFR
jgi:hypothetical protein